MTRRFARTKLPWIVVSGVVLAAAIGLFCLQSSTPVVPSETFTTDPARGWTAFGGSWKSQDGSVQNNSEDRGPKLMNGSERWRNYSVEADVQLLGPYGDAGLIIRSYGEEEGVDSYHGYFAGIRNMDNTFIVGRADFGWNQYIVQPILPEVTSSWYHIKLLAYECSIGVSVTNPSGRSDRAYVNDPRCIPAGRFGLKSYGTSSRWRDVHIRPSTQADLEQLIQGIEPVVVRYDFEALDVGLSTKALDRYMAPMQHEAEKHHFNTDTKTVGSLPQLSSDNSLRVTVHGVVTLVSPAIFLEDSTGAISIEPVDPTPALKVGDEVEASGDVSEQDFVPTLKHATIRLLSSNTPVSPLAVSAFELASGDRNGRFVEIEGELLSLSAGSGGTVVLTVEDGSQNFYAVVDQADLKLRRRRLEPGSRLRLRGVNTSEAKFTQNVVPFALLLPSAAGIEVVGLPSWWSPVHICLMIAVGVLAIVALQLSLSRIQRWRLQAVLDERERLALDIHDTLAQSFTGLGYQLEAVRNETERNDPVRRQVEVALEMVRSSHEEARRSIAALRPRFLSNTDLLHALRDVAERMLDSFSGQVKTSRFGEAGEIPLRLADALFRIGQEAVSNAVRHSKAESISISLRVEKAMITLIIQDNGIGFCTEERQNGFGIRGMKKRASEAGARLQIVSSPSDGTTVTVNAPVNSRRKLSQHLERAIHFMIGA